MACGHVGASRDLCSVARRESWRDPATGLVHVLQGKDTSSGQFKWGVTATRMSMNGRLWMPGQSAPRTIGLACGVYVDVDERGCVETGSVVLVPWITASDAPTCLWCAMAGSALGSTTAWLEGFGSAF